MAADKTKLIFNPLSGNLDAVQDVSNLVDGAASSADNAVVRFDSTTGKLIQNSLVIIDDSGKLTLGTDGTTSLDAITLQQLQAAMQGIDVKHAVRAATTVNITLSGPQTIDTVAVIAGDRILVKNQTTTSQNGIYVVAAGAWTRATDADLASELNGALVTVAEGSQLNTGWYQTLEIITIGTDPVVFNQFFGVGTYLADNNGIILTGQTFGLQLNGTTLSKSASGLKVATGGITNTEVNASAAIAYSKLVLTGSVVNADIASGAAIAYSKLALGTSIVNSDISASAAIAYSKLALTGSIVNADIAVAAAIAYSKLALANSITNADIASAAAIIYSKLSLSNSIVNADIATAAAIAYSKLNLTGSIVNADVNASAAIAYSKLNLATSIVNSDVNASAAIAYSKLALTNSVVNADVASAAAIAVNKLAALSTSKAVATDGSGFLVAATTTAAELNFVAGVTSSIQTQLNSKIGYTLQAKSANFNAASGFLYIVDSSGGAVTATLPAPSLNASIKIKDIGNASTNNITIARNASETIDGQTSYVMSSDYGTTELISDATNWYIV